MTENTQLLQHLPSQFRTAIDFDNARMHQITRLTRQALDEESNICKYAVFKTFSTIAAINSWKQVLNLDENNFEMETWFEKCIQSYLAEMEKLPQAACEKIAAILEESVFKDNDGIVLLIELDTAFRKPLR